MATLMGRPLQFYLWSRREVSLRTNARVYQVQFTFDYVQRMQKRCWMLLSRQHPLHYTRESKRLRLICGNSVPSLFNLHAGTACPKMVPRIQSDSTLTSWWHGWPPSKKAWNTPQGLELAAAHNGQRAVWVSSVLKQGRRAWGASILQVLSAQPVSSDYPINTSNN